jgi:hypothetical protein
MQHRLIVLVTIVACIVLLSFPKSFTQVYLRVSRLVKGFERTSKQQQLEGLESLSLDNKETLKDLPAGTVCIYKGSSCADRKSNPGMLVSCNRDLEDGTCMNFPSAGAVFTCKANEKVNIYQAPGCQASVAAAKYVGCIDLSIDAYFLVCCTCTDAQGPEKNCEKQDEI